MVKKKAKSCQRSLGTTPNLIQEKLRKVDSYLYTTIKIVSGQFTPPRTRSTIAKQSFSKIWTHNSMPSSNTQIRPLKVNDEITVVLSI